MYGVVASVIFILLNQFYLAVIDGRSGIKSIISCTLTDIWENQSSINFDNTILKNHTASRKEKTDTVPRHRRKTQSAASTNKFSQCLKEIIAHISTNNITFTIMFDFG